MRRGQRSRGGGTNLMNHRVVVYVVEVVIQSTQHEQQHEENMLSAPAPQAEAHDHPLPQQEISVNIEEIAPIAAPEHENVNAAAGEPMALEDAIHDALLNANLDMEGSDDEDDSNGAEGNEPSADESGDQVVPELDLVVPADPFQAVLLAGFPAEEDAVVMWEELEPQSEDDDIEN